MAEQKRGSGILILVAVLVLGVLSFMYSGGNYVKSLAGIGTCTETPVATFASPGNLLAVSSYLRQCGPGTDPVTHVILHAVGKLPAGDTNGLVREGEVFLESGKRAVSASWEGEREVTLDVAGSGAIPGAAEKTRAEVQVHIRRAR
ncbi:MAG TPA: hypothetical protein VGC21_05810 [Telluria sp.]|jgi:hypothetical protein